MPGALFLDDLVSPFYEKLGLDYRSKLRVGQICFTHVLYSYEHRELWRPDGYDGTQTMADLFKRQAAGGDAYRKRLPLVSPKLETDEEFPVVRAKRRPVVVVRGSPVDIQVASLQGGSKINWPLTTVLPIFSLVRKDESAKFPTEFVERLMKLEYPEFFFLPECPGVLSRDSFARLSRMTPAHPSHLVPSQWKLSDEAIEILLGNSRFSFGGPYEGKYAVAREMLLHP
jgi:hypothetical protein